MLNNFTLDADGASIIQEDKRLDTNGNTIVRQKFSNGLTWIRTETPNGFERMDFSHEMFKLPNGVYKADLNKIKSDFHDYY